MFCDVDTHMEYSSSQLTEVSPFAGEKMFHAAVLREEDSFGQTVFAGNSPANMQTEEDCENERKDGGSIDSGMEKRSAVRPRLAFISFNGDPFQDDESEEEKGEGEKGEEFRDVWSDNESTAKERQEVDRERNYVKNKNQK